MKASRSRPMDLALCSQLLLLELQSRPAFSTTRLFRLKISEMSNLWTMATSDGTLAIEPLYPRTVSSALAVVLVQCTSCHRNEPYSGTIIGQLTMVHTACKWQANIILQGNHILVHSLDICRSVVHRSVLCPNLDSVLIASSCSTSGSNFLQDFVVCRVSK